MEIEHGSTGDYIAAVIATLDRNAAELAALRNAGVSEAAGSLVLATTVIQP